MSPENAMKLLSNPVRMAVLQWLKSPADAFAGYSQLYDFSQYGVCASLIQDKAGLSQPATSLCLKVLQDAGMLEATKVGKWTYYRRSEPRIAEVTTSVTDFLKLL
ncbi:ArsR/SmtB family transcription factor [Erwinia sorbitola]|uniref:Helix-turn-helix domain-containing protein n=1 Tax=Erwinia sorbitola TaxID=2681984 RepID=A0A6I6EU81_9GAMM|nr:helix-turn-helix transcriptional regulator [Erwinia sorbitola]MTD25547.1 helix-turn-helix domain-containing protein [Erwinia sorbitola]QGU87893.1 helix-turn-helix domain-containing protein [Erwinia sorbitola]